MNAMPPVVSSYGVLYLKLGRLDRQEGIRKEKRKGRGRIGREGRKKVLSLIVVEPPVHGVMGYGEKKL